MSSARQEPTACSCQFCGVGYTPAGIKNHEKYCDENPHNGVHPDDAPELFEDERGESTPRADPDQRASTDGSGLPDRKELASEDKATRNGHESRTCVSCGSSDVIPAHQARKEYEQRLDDMPDSLRSTFDATERYCNSCFSVSGGDLDEPYCIVEGFQ